MQGMVAPPFVEGRWHYLERKDISLLYFILLTTFIIPAPPFREDNVSSRGARIFVVQIVLSHSRTAACSPLH